MLGKKREDFRHARINSNTNTLQHDVEIRGRRTSNKSYTLSESTAILGHLLEDRIHVTLRDDATMSGDYFIDDQEIRM